MTSNEKCLNPNCQRTARSRGLCDLCYQMANTLVRQGKTSWEVLEAKGRAKHPYHDRKGGGKRRQWLLS